MRNDSLTSVLAHAGVRRDKVRLPFSRSDAKGYGRAFPEELARFCDLADKGRVPELCAFEGARESAFVVEGKDAAVEHAIDGRKYIFPLGMMCHFSGLAPVASTGSVHYAWLVHVEADAPTPGVYEFGLGDASLRWKYGSLAALLAGQLLEGDREGGEDDAKLPPKTIALLKSTVRGAERAKMAASEDPLVLWKRARWVVTAIQGEDLGQVPDHMKGAPPLAAFSGEVGRLAKRPSLALYWLAAHALLGNGDAFRQAYDATKKSTSAFVLSMRSHLAPWREAGEKAPLLGLKPRRSAAILEQVRADAPSRLLERRASSTVTTTAPSSERSDVRPRGATSSAPGRREIPPDAPL